MNAGKLSSYLKILDQQCDNAEITGAAIDSRLVKPGMLFFACKGEHQDGNQFAQRALSAGAAVVVMDDKTIYESVRGNKILVENTIQSIHKMAKLRIRDLKAIKIAVTGSYGKTSTKDMLKLVLSEKYKTQATEGNYNNLLGVSITICGVNDNTEVLVIEMGSNSTGEIAVLSKLVEPEIAVLTGYGYAHVGKFHGLAQVVHEKLSLVDHLSGRKLVVANEKFEKGLKLKNEGLVSRTVIYGFDEKADVRATGMRNIALQTYFIVEADGKSYPCSVNYPFNKLVENFLGVFAVGLELGLKPEDMIEAVKSYNIPAGRGSISAANGLVIIDDTYNASMDTVLKAIDNLAKIELTPKYALIGEIGEIEGYEKEVYDEIINAAKQHSDIEFILHGSAYLNYEFDGDYSNINISLSDKTLKDVLNLIKGGVLLVKASHSYHFEKYVQYMASKFGVNDAL